MSAATSFGKSPNPPSVKGFSAPSVMSGASLVEGNPGLHTSSPSLPCLLFILARSPSLPPYYSSHPTQFPNWQTYITLQGGSYTGVPQQQRRGVQQTCSDTILHCIRASENGDGPVVGALYLYCRVGWRGDARGGVQTCTVWQCVTLYNSADGDGTKSLSQRSGVTNLRLG